MNKLFKLLFLLFIISSFLFSCKRESLPYQYKTKNVIVVIIDGARYAETWGDSTHQYIPEMANQMSEYGIINKEFYNNGPTYTLAGHTALTTGFYQEINNSGVEIPQYPSIFQYWQKQFQTNKDLSWIISSKDKLEILNNCQQTEWKGKNTPSVNCGINGNSSGYREDSISFRKLIEVLNTRHPRLVLFSLRNPDYMAHTGIWENYIQGIKSSDTFAYLVWKYIRQDEFYKGNTTLFITNDHGRHSDSIADGFASHGDGCNGCRHIFLYAYGPDFKQGKIIDNHRELTDISATIAELLHFKINYGNGSAMFELFE
ncbi:MAG: alkaline phosphatase family protein [Bacteroidales bacterium]